jgi:hypothetical protein
MMEDLDKIKSKIAKLLNLAERASNEHEAASAMSKARALMDKYDLQQVDIIEQDGQRHEMLAADASRAFAACPKWMSTLAVIVAQFNDCQAIFEGAEVNYKTENRPNARKKNWGKKIVFRGFRRDVELAVDMYARIIGALNGLFAQYLKDIGHEGRVPMSLNTNFKCGAVSTITRLLRESIIERQKLTVSNGTALVVAKSNAVAEYFGNVTYTTKKARAFTSDESADAYWEGKKRGHQVETHRKIQ